jgi:1-aminocyclopropane-1-carboxylate deaminase/D-cysteine desulfhydrase-like pyridoxal-dependent ACC family enzyme
MRSKQSAASPSLLHENGRTHARRPRSQPRVPPDRHAEGVARAGVKLWAKRDDLTGTLYGGNKVRKLEHLLKAARARGASRIVTIGAVGSHHVLATTLYGVRSGLRVAAILTPQPRSDQVIDNIRASIASGLETYPVAHAALVPVVLLKTLVRGDYFVPPGGSNVTGALGYVDGIAELLAQAHCGLAVTRV